MRKILVLLIAFSLSGCQNKSNPSDSPQNLVLRDIAALQTRHIPDADQGENFNAYRRLESLTRGRVNLDELSLSFYEDLLSEDVEATHTKFWLDWLIANDATLTFKSMQEATTKANEAISEVFPKSPNMQKLRIKNGLSKDDTSKDELLRLKYLENRSALVIMLPPPNE